MSLGNNHINVSIYCNSYRNNIRCDLIAKLLPIEGNMWCHFGNLVTFKLVYCSGQPMQAMPLTYSAIPCMINQVYAIHIWHCACGYSIHHIWPRWTSTSMIVNSQLTRSGMHYLHHQVTDNEYSTIEIMFKEIFPNSNYINSISHIGIPSFML